MRLSLLYKARALYDGALSLVYPRACAVCGACVESGDDGPACASCWASTRIFTAEDLVCWKCGAPAPGSVPEGEEEKVRCRRCEAEEFAAARACGAYESALRAAVLELKREPHVCGRLARLLREAATRRPLCRATRLMPVPLHPERLRERGFNQAAVLCQALARATGLTLDEWSLERTVHTERHRAGMDARLRRESVEGAFNVRRPRLVRGQRVLLIDDVYTTGATVSACAAALRAAGADEVFVLTAARPT